MISEPNQSQQASSPAVDTAPAPVPIWLVILLFLLLYWGMVYFDQRSAWFDVRVYYPYHNFSQLEQWQPATGAPNLVQIGRGVYNKPTCVACHQADGNGVAGQNPPLAGSEWVNEKEPGRIIRIALNGLSGPITVKNQSFNGVMVPWKDTLNDEEIA